jgi:pheromone shutdown protein TraB
MQRRTILHELAAPVPQRGWTVESRVRAVAGALVLVSAVLSALVSPWWLLLTTFVGLNLLQSAFTDWCLMSNLLALLFPKLAERS